MKHITLTFLALATLSIGCINGADIAICKNVANGVFLANLSNCSEYYTCWNETSYPASCPSDLYFSAKTQRCDFASETECVPQCNSTMTTFAYDKTCNKYVLCYDNVPVLRQCLDNLQFNADTDRCDYPQNVDCQANMCTGVNDPENIVFLNSHANCSKYFICYNGVAVEKQCASGLYFNIDKQGCDYKANVNCTIAATSRIVLPYAKSPPTRAQINCPKQGSHFYPNEDDPTSYYFCLNGNGVVLTCSPGLIYDKTMETCRESTNVKN